VLFPGVAVLDRVKTVDIVRRAFEVGPNWRKYTDKRWSVLPGILSNTTQAGYNLDAVKGSETLRRAPLSIALSHVMILEAMPISASFLGDHRGSSHAPFNLVVLTETMA
jgi:hypothetical protein